MDIFFQYKLITHLTSPLTWLSFSFGLILGSFFNVCIYRIPLGIFWKETRSACPHCEEKIPFYLNIPIISYLFLKGRSHCCKEKISVQYPIVELLTALMMTGLYWKHPFILNSQGDWSIHSQELIRYLHMLIFSSFLIICSVIDFHHKIIPDVLSLPMILLSSIVVYFHPELDWRSSLYGVLIGGGIIYAIAWIYYLIRKTEGIGMGDAKLLAAIGGWLGYQALFHTVFIASIMGSVLGLSYMAFKRDMNLKAELPFGPFLAFGALFYQLASPKFLELISIY